MSARSISKKNAWLSVVNHFNADSPTEILITGPIGASWWDDSGTSEKDFLDALKDIPEGKPITVGINSEGGAVKDGLGIYHALRRRGDSVTTRIDGYAVSIASVIALAGKRRVSPESSIWMIHEPWSMAVGDSETMRKEAAALDAHAEAIAAVYTERSGMKAEDARAKMKAETWFRGNEAKEWGFATETGSEPAALAALDFTKFKNVPKEILQLTLAAAKGVTQPQATAQAECAPITATATISSAVEVGDQTKPAGNPPPANQNKEKRMEDNKDKTAAAVAPAAPAPDPSAAILAKLDAMQMEILAMKNPPVATQKPRVEVTREGLADLLDQRCGKLDAAEDLRKAHAKRYQFMIRNWNDLTQAFPREQGQPIFNANTDTASGTLTTAVLASGVITVADEILAPLSVFTRNFSSGRIGRNVIEIPKVTAGGTAQSNPTSFEDTTNFVASVDDIPITPAHIVAGAHITNAELQNGWRMDWWLKKKVGEVSNKIKAVINAVLIEATYTNTVVKAAPAAFGDSELQELYASIKNARGKSLLLDGSAYARLLSRNLQTLNPTGTNSLTGAGFRNVYEDNYWTGGATNLGGFACGEDALCVAAALPKTAPNESRIVSRGTLTLPDLGMSIDVCDWFASSGRVSWMTLELMFAAAAGDVTLGTLYETA